MHFTMGSDLSPLLEYDLIYLASPYTKYPHGIDEAAHDVALVTGRLVRNGIKVFSPVVHSHFVARVTSIDPLDHEFWMKADYAFMHKCDALLICQMTGWEDSYGVNLEIKNFTEDNKPIHTLVPGVLR